MEQFRVELIVYPLITTNITSSALKTLHECAPDSHQFLRNCKPINHELPLWAVRVVDGSMIYKVLDYELIKASVSFIFNESPYVFVKNVSTFYPVLTLKYALSLDLLNHLGVSALPSQIILLHGGEEMRDDLILAAYEVTVKSTIQMRFCREKFIQLSLTDQETTRQLQLDIFPRQAVKGVTRELHGQFSISNAQVFLNCVPLNDDEIVANYYGKDLRIIRLSSEENHVWLRCLDGSRRIDFEFDIACTVLDAKEAISERINFPTPKIALSVNNMYLDNQRMLLYYRQYIEKTVKIHRLKQPETAKFTIMSHSVNRETWYISADWTIAELQRRFSEETGIASSNCSCLCGGRLLEDYSSVGQEGIIKNSSLIFCFRVVEDIRQLTSRVTAAFQDVGGEKRLVYEYGAIPPP